MSELRKLVERLISKIPNNGWSALTIAVVFYVLVLSVVSILIPNNSRVSDLISASDDQKLTYNQPDNIVLAENTEENNNPKSEEKEETTASTEENINNTDSGANSPANINQPEPSKLFSFIDYFNRPNGPLGGGWINCKDLSPNYFEPLGVHNGGAAILNPETRSGTYDTTPPSGHPPTMGRIYPGIGCAGIRTGVSKVSLTIQWSGNHGIAGSLPTNHVESGPLLYITPGNSRYAFGSWLSELYGVPIMFVGYIGGPPELFEPIATTIIPGGHTTGMVRNIELRAEELGKVTVWVDGKQLDFKGSYGLNPIPVDPALLSSTMHGFSADAHMVNPRSNIINLNVIEGIQIKELP